MLGKVWVRIGLAIVLVSAGVGGFVLANLDTWRAAAVLRDTVSAPPDLADRTSEQMVTITEGVDATLYRPAGLRGPLPGFVIVHGAIGQGPDDPRFVDLARALAAEGATVVAPRLDSLARFRVDVQDPARIGAAIRWLADRDDLVEGKVAVLGISIGGSYGLLATLDPAVEEHTSAVLVFGGHHDLERLLTRWLTEPTDTPTVLDPLTEGRRLVMLGNVDKVVAAHEVAAVSDCLQALLADDPCSITRPLGPAARAMVEAARSEAPLDPDRAARLLDPMRDDLRALSPATIGRAPVPPVYLLHAEGDPVVPTSDSMELAALLTELGASSELEITGVFEHVDAASTPSLVEAWPLLRFVGRFLGDAGM